jgi:hypothetical protein
MNIQFRGIPLKKCGKSQNIEAGIDKIEETNTPIINHHY